jgi:Rad3-related DNA helicase
MPSIICYNCHKSHTVDEYEEDRFCSVCGALLPSKVSSEEDFSKAGWINLFPYDPYPVQIEFMEDVERIVGGDGVLLAEACNGFGKTVSSLSSLLSMNKKIIYATRTHEQVRQVLREIRKINETSGNHFRAVNLASRGHLCINPECKELSRREAQELCQMLRREDECPFKSEINRLPSRIPSILSPKELISAGRRYNLCPYYLARLIAKRADVVAAPYPYIFDPNIRRNIGLDLEGKVLILDEGHNIDQVGQDSLSDTLSETVLSSAAEELKSIRSPLTPIRRISELLRRKVTKQPQVISADILERDIELALGTDLSLVIDHYSPLVDYIRKNKMKKGNPPISYLNGFLSFLKLLQNSKKDKYVAVYKRGYYGVNTVEYRCLDPSLAIEPVVNASSGCLIMSGTLSPLNLFAEIIGLKEAERKSYPSIQDPENVKTIICPGVTSTYRERTDDMIGRMGKVIDEGMKKVEQGALIFFTQRVFMERCLDEWGSLGLIEARRGMMYLGDKPLFREGSDARRNRDIVIRYKKIAQNPGGAILCCVFRGRNSEGSNFPGDQARGIFLVGVPYANYGDPMVKAQISYFNKLRRGLGNQWYTMDAFRAANQALGRGIRGRDDWCSYWLLDKRYASHSTLISDWAKGKGLEIQT